MLKKTVPSGYAFFLTFLLLVCLPVLTFFSFLPKSAGADEPSHQATAWFAVEHLNLPSTNYLPSDEIPMSLVVKPCFVDPYAIPSIACLQSQAIEDKTFTSAPISNYALPYFVIVGLGQKIAIQIDWSLAPLGGRLAGMFLNLLILFFSMKILAKYFERATVLLYCALTPMSIFYLTVVNPSGWEVSTSVLFLAALVNFTKTYPSNKTDYRTAKIGLVLAASLFVTSRPLAIMWLVLIVLLVYSVVNITKANVLLIGKLLVPSMVMAFGWNMTHKPGLMSLPGHEELTDVGIKNYISWFIQSLNLTPEYFRQMVGVLGWGDVAVSPFLSFLWIISLTFLGGAVIPKLKRPRLFISTSLGGLVLLPAIIQTSYWNSWPAWWQGRYQLALLTPLFILLLMKSEEIGRKINYVIGVALFLTIFMQVFAFSRYGFGLSKVGIPEFSLGNQYSNLTTLIFLVCMFIQGLVAVQLVRSTSIFPIQAKK